MITIRLPDWIERLHAYLDSVSARAHDYERWNGVALVVGAIEAQTGMQIAPDMLDDEGCLNAEFLMQFRNGETIKSLFNLLMNRELSPPLTANRGDLALLEKRDGFDHLGIVSGSGTALFVSQVGLTEISLSDCAGVWYVGAAT